MAFVKTGRMCWPMGFHIDQSGTLVNIAESTSLDSAGEYVGVAFKPGAALTSIEIGGFRVHTFTSSGIYDLRLEHLDAVSGHPSGTLVGTSTNVQVQINAAGFVSATFTSVAVVSADLPMAFVVRCCTGQISMSRSANVGGYSSAFPYIASFIDGTTLSKNSLLYHMAVGNTSVMADIGARHPITSVISQNFNSGSTPNQYGAFFYHPAALIVQGVEIGSNQNVGGTDARVFLLNDGGTTIAVATIDGSRANLSTVLAPWQTMFSSPVTLAASTTCRLFMRPNDSTNFTYVAYAMTTATWRKAFQEGDGVWYRTSRTNAGGPTDDPTQFPFMRLIISHLSDTVSGGGAVTTVGTDTATGNRFNRGFN